MSQSILTTSRADFIKKITSVSTGQLKQLLEGLFTYIKKNAESWMKTEQGKEIIYDLERKQSLIWKELQRRNVLKNKTNDEFMKWLYSKHERRVF